MMKFLLLPTLLVGVSLLEGPMPADAYTETLVGTDVSFTMVPIPAGSFLLGASPKDKAHEADELPNKTIMIDGFWMSTTEVSHNLYDVYRNKEKDVDANGTPRTEGIVRPSPPYEDPSHGMGGSNYPASGMTQFAALQFCKWLSERTGKFYRLPTEAEWEYACRAGTNTPYFFGKKAKMLADYAWYSANSDQKLHPVATRQPNPWGLYDMYGNVAEWTLDQYQADAYTTFADKTTDPWYKPKALHPRSVRGGSYQDDAATLRSSNRIESDLQWKKRDPQIPKSFWWNTDSPFVGFRIIRPMNEPSQAEQKAFWEMVLGG
ncbi:MAG TPA: SUMF1/EgtB/PvdO family nonheme iron enzyme [Saprospiraceae bacterium]|nr:SUMF1/EgtB/PvdO family nonheme iron enzyme [Saprospiraceae bacterium]